MGGTRGGRGGRVTAPRRPQVEEPQGSGDDTGLNAIRLLCGGTGTVTSSQGAWGKWGRTQFCPRGHLVAFRLRTEERQGRGDDTAANALDFRCSQGHLLQGAGTPWGSWGAWSPPCAPGGICGLQTRVEPPQGRGDDTALNNVRFFCCQ
uniref:Vitelline membrane outer layer protein 1 homolog n=1 Tax=Apteryx owenii TaxID=8824 RepID=A0A8B9QCN8_APTOW